MASQCIWRKPWMSYRTRQDNKDTTHVRCMDLGGGLGPHRSPWLRPRLSLDGINDKTAKSYFSHRWLQVELHTALYFCRIFFFLGGGLAPICGGLCPRPKCRTVTDLIPFDFWSPSGFHWIVDQGIPTGCCRSRFFYIGSRFEARIRSPHTSLMFDRFLTSFYNYEMMDLNAKNIWKQQLPLFSLISVRLNF